MIDTSYLYIVNLNFPISKLIKLDSGFIFGDTEQ